MRELVSVVTLIKIFLVRNDVGPVFDGDPIFPINSKAEFYRTTSCLQLLLHLPNLQGKAALKAKVYL